MRQLKNPCDVHWWASKELKEYIKRTIHDAGFSKSLSAYERKRWMKPGWEQDLEEKRKRHRKAGIPDSNFK